MSSSSYVEVRLSEDDLKAPKDSTLCCPICVRSFRNANAFRMHKVKTHNFITSESDFRLKHRGTQKGIEKRYFCPVTTCPRNQGLDYFTALKSLKQHYMKVHGEKLLRCEHCGIAKFSLQRDLVYHMKHLCDRRECGPRLATPKMVEEAQEKTQPEAESSEAIRQKTTAKLKIKNVVILTPARAIHFIPILPRRPSRSIATQTTFETTHYQYQQMENERTEHEVNRNVATNVTASELCSMQSASLPPISSISFQPDEARNRNNFYSQTAFACSLEPTSSQPATSSHTYNYGVLQNDCGVQSNLEYVPETRHVETHMDDFDFVEIWHHNETQTSEPFGSDALTQTVNDFMDCGIMTDGPYESWNHTQAT